MKPDVKEGTLINLRKIKHFLLGRPLDSDALGEEKYTVAWGLPILSSDAISSVAYAGQEMLAIMLPVIGLLAFQQMTYISGVIILLLLTLMISYRQTIQHYPNGGGAYIVAKANLGNLPGIVAGAALAADYILTVSVSISSGVQQIATAFQPIAVYTVPICVGLILLIALGNLRGIREASRIFGIPTYLFIFGLLTMIIVGFIKLALGDKPPEPIAPTVGGVVQPITVMLMLRAFSNGCAALTGVEAVSNGVPNFKEPARKRAKTVLLLLSLTIFVLFGGIAIIANFYKVIPDEKNALLVLIAGEIFGKGFMYYYITITTFVILILAANTAYADFPMLLSVMSRDGYAPRQLSMRGGRLSFSTGIVTLSVVAALLIVVFQARVDRLIGLYAIGVFISFTLSQSGMFIHWVKSREKGWRPKALINGFGALVTAVVVVIIAITKFSEGAWIIVILIPLIVFAMLQVKKHYTMIHDQLRLEPEEYERTFKCGKYKVHAVVPVDSINRASIRALRYAKTITSDITAFNVACDEETAKKNREKYAQLGTDIPLVIRYSKNKDVVRDVVEMIESEEAKIPKEDIIAVVLPQFITRRPLEALLHNRTRKQIQKRLLKHRQVVICTIPLQLTI